MEPVGETRLAFQTGARVTECIHPGCRTAQLLLTYSIFLTRHISDSREGFVEREDWILFLRLIQLSPSHTLAATRWTLQLPVLRAYVA